MGNWFANVKIPSKATDPVSRYTSHCCAVVCIQVPTSEMSCPMMKSWKLLCFKARNLAGSSGMEVSPVVGCTEAVQNYDDARRSGLSTRETGPSAPIWSRQAQM